MLGPRAAARGGRAAPRRRHHAVRPPGRRAVRHADRARGRAPDRPQRQRERQVRAPRSCHSGEVEIEGDELPDEEPLDWDPAEEAEEEAAADAVARGPGRGTPLLVRARHRRRQDRRRARLRGGLAHRRHPDPHPPPQPRGPVPRRAARPRLQEAHLGAAAEERQRRAARRRPGHGRDLPVVRAQRRQGLRRVHDRHLRRGAHGARREDERLDPPVDRPGVRRHDRHRRADRAPRDRPLPDADLALRPRSGRAPRRDRAAALRAHPAGRGRALDRERAAAPRRGRPGLRPGRAGRAARPDAVQPGGRRPLQDALQGPAGRRLLRRREARAQRGQGLPGRGHQGEGRLGRDAEARAHAHPGRLRARRDRRARERAAAGRGLELAARDGLHAPGADGLEADLPAARGPRDAPQARARSRASSWTSSTRRRRTTTRS